MKTRISRRLFLSGAALLGAGIALDRVELVATATASPVPPTATDRVELVATATASPVPPVATIEPTVEPTTANVAVAAGAQFSLVLTRNGEVVGWGANGGQDVPSGLRDVVAVAARNVHALALTRSGEVVAWGRNGDGATDVPSGLRDVVAVSAGGGHSLALTRSGEVVAWGYNEYGQTDVPSGLGDVVAVEAGGDYSLALTRSGEVMAWGWNRFGETDVPGGLRDVVAVAAGSVHALALTRSGEVVAWGSNVGGQTDVPSGLRDVVAVAAGGVYSLALTRSGEVVAWGANNYGQTNVPSGLRDVVAVAAGTAHSLALTRSGEVVAWGWNNYGQANVPSEISVSSTQNETLQIMPTAAPAIGRQTVVDLSFWYWDAAGQIWADEYNKLNRGVRVNFVNMPFADCHDKLLTSFASGTGSPDIASLEIGRIGGFQQKGGLFDLLSAPFSANRYRSDFVSYKWTQGMSNDGDGRLFAMPWDSAPAAFWYRTDIFESLGLPTDTEAVAELVSHTYGRTWSDFFTLAQRVADRRGGNQKIIADAGTDIYGAAARQKGEGYFQGNKLMIVENMTRPAQLASQFRNQGLDANIGWWGQDWDAGVKNDAFAGMLIGCWMQSNLARGQSQTIGKWRIVPAPEASFNWGGSFCAIPEQCQYPELAWDFVQWACCSAEGQNAMFKQTGIFPAYKPAWNDPLYDKPVDFFGGQRAYREWTYIADNIISIPRSLYDLQAEDIVNAQIRDVLENGRDPVRAMQDAESMALQAIEGSIP
jgi:multiple sugar transport system substrate-binding protein